MQRDTSCPVEPTLVVIIANLHLSMNSESWRTLSPIGMSSLDLIAAGLAGLSPVSALEYDILGKLVVLKDRAVNGATVDR